jgi:hypothetical protein
MNVRWTSTVLFPAIHAFSGILSGEEGCFFVANEGFFICQGLVGFGLELAGQWIDP